MKKRTVSCLLLIVMVLSAAGVTAYADEPFVAVTLESGDTVIGICEILGLDYQKAKNAILLLNGWGSEAQMAYLNAGDTVLLPKSADYIPAAEPAEQPSYADEIGYYVLAYTIQPGDTIENIYAGWGLRFEKYVNLIRLLNGVEDLDGLEVGVVYYLPTSIPFQSAVVTVLAHTMQWGENAYTVFAKYGIEYSDYAELLWRFNGGRDLSRIALGEKLMVPVV